MQFNVQLEAARLDLPTLEQLLQLQDPSALVDFDALSRTLRVSTTLEERDIAANLARIGHEVTAGDVERQASTCCGGCGG